MNDTLEDFVNYIENLSNNAGYNDWSWSECGYGCESNVDVWCRDYGRPLFYILEDEDTDGSYTAIIITSAKKIITTWHDVIGISVSCGFCTSGDSGSFPSFKKLIEEQLTSNQKLLFLEKYSDMV